MTGSVQVNLVEVHEGLRLFVRKDRLANRREPVVYTPDTEQVKDGEIKTTDYAQPGQMQLR